MNIATLWKQLSILEFFRVLLARAAKRVFDKYASISYGQAGEDAMIWRLLHHKKSGYYVDVGAHHPVRWSNTYALYLLGWSGIAIDANEEFRAEFRKQRPNDLFVAACVTDNPGERLFRVYADRALSSVTSAQVFVNDYQYRLEKAVKMKGRTLEEILIENNTPNDFDFLSIDVENHDLEVLMSFDISRYRPQLIVVEAHNFDPVKINAFDAAVYLNKNGYKLASFFGNNLFFIREEHNATSGQGLA